MGGAVVRVPDGPSGGPGAVAPPLMWTLACGMPRSCIANIATQANASFTSNRSTSESCQPVFSISLVIAPTGAVVNFAGSCAWAATPTTVATGVRPLASATLLRVSTTAEATSEIEQNGRATCRERVCEYG